MARITKKSTPVSKKQIASRKRAATSGLDRMVILFTIVNRKKGDFYADLLQSFEVNLQLILSAQGTADREAMTLLGLTDSDKAVIISIIRRDKTKEAMAMLDEKFRTVKNGKGIAYTVPMSSTIGVLIYQFLSNKKGGSLG